MSAQDVRRDDIGATSKVKDIKRIMGATTLQMKIGYYIVLQEGMNKMLMLYVPVRTDTNKGYVPYLTCH